MKGTGLEGRVRKRLLAESLPIAISDLEPYPLQGELQEVIPMIAFSAMAEVSRPWQRRPAGYPPCCAVLVYRDPQLEAMAEKLMEEYNSKHMILSDYYARLPSPAPERSAQLHLPVSEITAVTESVIARNPNELARQATRQALTTLIQRGIRATLVCCSKYI